ncbi:hypothetical protein KKF91_19340 [Myxococcota bacterium]|nr:hypothetical protein [Myxococcota bacterium]MBU1432701.1 hypothetical protein [Myxococcota bacterium]MBU1899138.1 hypothetical protein [Myxococcota bacterium]
MTLAPDLPLTAFTYGALRRFLRQCQDQGEIRPLGEGRAGPGVLLRHDIDWDLEAALRVARLEAELGIRASYFILMTGCYNPHAGPQRALIRALSALGMEIGLHFDPSLYPPEALTAAAVAEAQALEALSGQPVRSLSLHNPSVRGEMPLIPGFINAYDPARFAPARYLSDSCQDLRGKDPHRFIEQATTAQVQVLLHPEHFSDEGWGYPEVARAAAQAWVRGFEASLADHRAWRAVGRPLEVRLRPPRCDGDGPPAAAPGPEGSRSPRPRSSGPPGAAAPADGGPGGPADGR